LKTIQAERPNRLPFWNSPKFGFLFLKQLLGHPLLFFIGCFAFVSQFYSVEPGYSLNTWGILTLLVFGKASFRRQSVLPKKLWFPIGGLAALDLVVIYWLFPEAYYPLFPEAYYPLLQVFEFLLFFLVGLPWLGQHKKDLNPIGLMLIFGFANAGLSAWVGQASMVRLFLSFSFFAFFVGAFDLAWWCLRPAHELDPKEG